MPSSDREYHTLDGMRGVAALAVFALHATPMLGSPSLPGAYLAVDLFFVLSGFVLEHVYGPRFAAGLSAGDFLRARVIRLYPLYILGAAIGIVSGLIAFRLGAGQLNGAGVTLAAISAVLMLPSPTFAQTILLYPLNVPGWSLFLELVINVVFALFWRRLTMRVLMVLVAVSALLLAPAAFALGNLDAGSTWTTLAPGLPRVAFSFFAGVLLRRFHLGARIPGLGGLVLPFLLLPLMAFSPPAGFRPAYELICVLAVFPAMIATGSTLEPPPWGVPLFRFLGLISFPLYAIHYPILEFVRRAMHARGLGAHVPPLVLLLAIGAVMVGVSAVLARVYDVPARRSLTRLTRRVAG